MSDEEKPTKSGTEKSQTTQPVEEFIEAEAVPSKDVNAKGDEPKPIPPERPAPDR